MLMQNPNRKDPDEDPSSEESSKPRFLPFFAWPLLVCAVGMDIWTVRVAGTPFQPVATIPILLFLITWYAVARWCHFKNRS